MSYTAVNRRSATCYLHAKHVTLQNGREHTLFCVAPSERRGEAASACPPGHVVREDPRNGRLTLKRVEQPSP